MAVLEAEIPVAHRVFVPGGGTGRHGSAQEGTLSDPITRYAYQMYPKRWGTPRNDVTTPEIEAVTSTDMMLDVPDATVYKKRDTVEINGVSYVVQGRPEDWEGAQMMPEYDGLFGGTVLMRRIE